MKSIQLLSARASASVLRSTTRQLSVRPIAAFSVPQKHSSLSSRLPSKRAFSTYPSSRISILPDSSDPEPPKTQDSSTSIKQAADINEAEYNEIADQYMNTLQLVLEETADNEAQRGLEVEYSAGVLTLTHPQKGTYVINKQPPNKQIWLSSPESGPKRFDWVLATTTSHDAMNSKQDTEGSSGAMGDDGQLGGGKWIYLRDGTGLSDLIKEELDIVVAKPDETDATPGREGPGKTGGGDVEG